MNQIAKQWLRLAEVYREHEKKVRQHRSRSVISESSLPKMISSTELIEFFRKEVSHTSNIDGCFRLDVKAIYQAILSDPKAEEEILQRSGFDRMPKRLDALYEHAALFTRELEAAALQEQKGRVVGKSQFFRMIGVFVLFCFVVLSCIGLWGFFTVRSMESFATTQGGSGSGDVQVNIPRGAGHETIASRLEEKGVIGDQGRFYSMLRYSKYWKKLISEYNDLGRIRLRSGNYTISTQLTPLQIIKIMQKGPIRRSYKLIVPEGFNVWKIAARLEKNKICKARDFLILARDRSLGKKLLGWTAKKNTTFPFEGFLYPDTYRFHHNTSAEKVLKRMVSRFKRVYTKQLADRARQKYHWGMRRVITLASIIEKETGKTHERPMISTVFHNRIKKGWKLQTDPTIIYGLLPNFNGNITYKDIRNRHAYNTYAHKGFPPGPIASPGIAAIRAALYPRSGCHIFFVSKNNGTHVFTCTLKEHNRWVNYYQKGGRNK